MHSGRRRTCGQHPHAPGGIGLEHTAILGNTLSKIAYAKGGIFKHRVPAFSVIQAKEVEMQLRKCAAEVEVRG